MMEDEEVLSEEAAAPEDEGADLGLPLEERLRRRQALEEGRAFEGRSNRGARGSRRGADDAGEDDMARDSLKRASKSAPAVMRSDRPVKRLRLDPNLQLHAKTRDPRFNEISGKLNHRKFMDSYAFLGEYQEKEAEGLGRQLRGAKDEGARAALKERLTKYTLSTRCAAAVDACL